MMPVPPWYRRLRNFALGTSQAIEDFALGTSDLLAGAGRAVGRDLLNIGREHLENPIGAYGGYLKGLGVGAAQGAVRLADLVPGTDLSDEAAWWAERVPESTTGKVAAGITSILPEFTPIGDVAAPLYTSEAVGRGAPLWEVGLEAAGMLPLVPSLHAVGSSLGTIRRGQAGVEGSLVNTEALKRIRSNQHKAVQSFRDLDEATAHEAARAGLHLRPIRNEIGRVAGYHGAPPRVKSSQSLSAWRREFDRMVRTGAEYGRFWYDEAREGTQEATRLLPDDETTKFALSQGVMSQGSDPNVQHGFAMRGWNQYSRDAEISAGRWPSGQSERMRQVMEEGRTDIGPKTGPYGVTMNPRKEMPWIPVTDMWVMRGLGYATETPTEAQRAFIDGEMLRTVQRMNANLPEGARPFTVPEVQASMWTYLKGRDLHATKPNTYPTLEAGMQEAAKSHSHFLDKTVMNLTRETAPGRGTGHLQGVLGDEGMMEYLRSEDPFMIGHGDERQDVLTREAGLLQRDALNYQGEYMGDFAPGTNVRVLGDQPKGGGGLLSQEFMEQVQGMEMLRGLMQGQNAVAGTRVAPGAPEFGVHIPMEAAATKEQMTRLAEVANPRGMFAVDTGRGVELMPFDEDLTKAQLDPSDIRKELIRSTDLNLFGKSFGSLIADITGSEGVRRGHQRFYRSVLEGTTEGAGEATRATLEQIDRTPGLARRLEASEVLRTVAGSQRDLNQAVSEMGFGDARPDIQRMLDIIAKEGLLGLRKALDRGVALPLFAGVGLGLANRERRRERVDA